MLSEKDPKKQKQTPTNDDPFDLERLKLSQDFPALAGVKKQLTTVPVGKPPRQSFFRTHPEPEWRFNTYILELKETRESYLVDPALRDDLATELVAKCLFVAITLQGSLLIWPIKLPDPDGRHDSWNRSGLEIATGVATKEWIRLVSNPEFGLYEPMVAMEKHPDPQWPDITVQEAIRIAFKDRLIASLDHPAVRLLRGRK